MTQSPTGISSISVTTNIPTYTCKKRYTQQQEYGKAQQTHQAAAALLQIEQLRVDALVVEKSEVVVGAQVRF
ncbi:MAG: hypothetical protein IPM98_08510 [Lewinellaceae bacterium]|nr:hypothetical protein [Lewinellaceae bacterium]